MRGIHSHLRGDTGLGSIWISTCSYRIVDDALDLDLALVVGLDDVESISGYYGHAMGSSRIMRGLLVGIFNVARTLTRLPCPAVVFADIDLPTCVSKSGSRSSNFFPWRILMEASISSLKLCGRILVDSPQRSFHPLGEQDGNLDGKGDRPLLPARHGTLPIGRLGIEQHLQGEPRQSGLDIPRGCRPIAEYGHHPSALGSIWEVLLARADQRHHRDGPSRREMVPWLVGPG